MPAARSPRRSTRSRNGSIRPAAWVAAACAGLAPPALAQDNRLGDDLSAPRSQAAGVSPGTRLYGTLDLEQTFSEMRDRTAGPNGLTSITRVQPGVRLSSRSGRVQGYLNYSGSYLYRTGREDSDGSEWQNSLDASFLAEAVQGWAFLDARASVTQQQISAFGRPVDDGTQANRNRTEVATLWLSPYLSGSFGGLASYEVRVIGSTSRSSGDLTPNSHYGAGLLSLASEGQRRVGWRLAAKRERVEYSNSSAPSTTDRINGSLVFTPDADFRFTLSGGGESADLGGPVRQEYENYGAGFQWTPSPRTNVSANLEERYFGRGHNVAIQYRTAQSVFTYSDVRDTNDGIDPFNLGQPLTLYQLLYQQAAARQPDPALREQEVLDYITLDLGRDPNEVVYAGTLVNGLSVERRQFLSWALQGRRTTLSVQAYRTETERIDQAASTVPGANETVIQTGYDVALSHRLTPELAATLSGSRTMTKPTATRGGTDEKQASVGLTTRLGRRTTGSLFARYRVFNSPTDPYRETELTGRISLLF